ncbi:MAG: HipA domain-containing protein [Rhodomicrobium sp.]
MIRVWSDNRTAGVLDRLGPKGSTFAYDPQALPERAVSVTMPVRVQSWNTQFGLAPIFEMNLPEGALRERLIRRFAKATGRFDDLDLLSVVGRTQIGRLRFSALDAELDEEVPFQSIDEILRARRGGALFDYLLDTFAAYSGLSGVQPKVMIRAREGGQKGKASGRESSSLRSATHIVKLWDAAEFPELAANEFFCLSAARAAGLTVPNFQLSEDGAALILERFDLNDGAYLGFEDFCVLNGLQTADKYSGSYESRLFKRLSDYVGPASRTKSARDLFRLFALNCALRNGDAHLKNFGILYNDVNGAAELAPVYDLVTTTAYLPQDAMALTLNGTTRWPDVRKLIELGQVRANLSKKDIEGILEATADALSDTLGKMRRYFRKSDFPETGKRIAAAWEEGIRETLQQAANQVVVEKPKQAVKKRSLAAGEALILDSLRKKKGHYTGPQRALAEELQIPLSTLNAAIRRLEGRKLIRRDKKILALMDERSRQDV